MTVCMWAARIVLLQNADGGKECKGYLDVAVFLVRQPIECGQRQVVKPRPDALVRRSNKVDNQLQLMQLGETSVEARIEYLNPRQAPFREGHMRLCHLAHL